MSKKSMLHEIIAVEKDVQGVFTKVVHEAVTTFTKKADRFIGSLKTLAVFDDKDTTKYPEVHQHLDTTVPDKLAYTDKAVINYFDVLLAKEATNQVAVADVVIDGVVVAEELPATFLLGMETRLKHLRIMYEAIPTLAPGIKWELDPSIGEYVFKAAYPEETIKTESNIEPVTMAPATKEHPAQVVERSVVKNVGKYTKVNWSGMISAADKSELLKKIDNLISACKQARQRANTATVVKKSVGAKFLNYIYS